MFGIFPRCFVKFLRLPANTALLQPLFPLPSPSPNPFPHQIFPAAELFSSAWHPSVWNYYADSAID